MSISTLKSVLETIKRGFRAQRLTLIYLCTTLIAIGLATQLGARFQTMPLILLGVISPMLLALLFSYYEQGWAGIRTLFSHPEGFNFNLAALGCALFLPFALMTISIALFTGEWLLPNAQAMVNKLPILVILMTGEEFGWRRYAFARLANSYSFMLSACLVTLVWWLWHYPGYLIGIGTPEEMPFWLFALMLMPASVLMAYLYRWTRNVYLVILVHVSSNLAFNALPILPEHSGDSGAFIIYCVLLWLLVLPVMLNKKLWCSPRPLSS